MKHRATSRQMYNACGTRQFTTNHVRRLARHFALPANYFLEVLT